MPDATLPPRIWVVGHCGSGKTTVARQLARALGVEATHLDDLHWRPGWVEADPVEEAAAIARVVVGPTWVVDGNYRRLRAPHERRVDLFVWLDLPLRITFPRIVRRGLVRAVTRERCCNGNTESLRGQFLDRDSLLLWSLRMDRRRRRELAEGLAGRPHVRLRTPRAIDAWLSEHTGGDAPDTGLPTAGGSAGRS